MENNYSNGILKAHKFVLPLFIILAIIQISASASIIYKYENILSNGKVYKFKTAPVDPYDAFRGKYVLLGLESQEIKLEKDHKKVHGQKVYASLKVNKEGFASIDKLYTEKPDNDDYINATIQSIFSDVNNKGEIAILNLPIDRYYMEEDIAPKAEDAYRASNSTPGKFAYISVRIKSGAPVIEQLYIDNLPVRDYINKNNK